MHICCHENHYFFYPLLFIIVIFVPENTRAMSIHIDVIPNRTYKPTILLRKAWREGKKVRRDTLTNLTHWPEHLVEALRASLKGGVVFQDPHDAFPIERSLPHGHVACLYGMAKRLKFDLLLGRQASRERDLALSAILMRILSPVSKLATARQLSSDTATTSLGAMLGLGQVKGNEVLDMLDWLLSRQKYIERTLSRRHLEEGTMILYDVSSTYLEGNKCALAALGYSRDKRRDKKQIVFGLLCAPSGCPIAIEVFKGNTADPTTLQDQIIKIKHRFGLSKIVLVGDRGMITSARIEAELKPEGLDWITALSSRQIRRMCMDDPNSEPGLLFKELLDIDEDCVGEVQSDLYEGERFMICKNPRLLKDRRENRERLLSVTDDMFKGLALKVSKGTIKGVAQIERKIGQTIARKKMLKHYKLEVKDDALVWERNEKTIRKEEALDGIYVIRTNVDADQMDAHKVVSSYKSLAYVEQAFRSIKSSSLRIRPMYVYSEAHVKGHVFLCMLAYYLEWHLKKALAPVLFTDADKTTANKSRKTPIGKSEVSASAKAKHRTKKTPDELSVHSFQTLLEDMGTLAMNEVIPNENSKQKMCVLTKPTDSQKRVFELLKINPKKYVASNVTN